MIEPKPCIITLPITPNGNPNLGLMVSPFIMDVLAKRLAMESVLALNVRGTKLFSEDVESHFQGYMRSNQNLDIKPSFVWRDDQGENIFWLNNFFHKLVEEGHIVRASQQIMKCPCGVVESLVDAENMSFNRRLYFEKHTKRYCKVCGDEVIISEEIVYLFRFPDIRNDIHVFPEFYKKELVPMVERFLNKNFLISRFRKSALTLWTGEEQILLDVDFVWQMALPLLRHYGYKAEVLVGSNKNLMACCFMIAMSHLIDRETPLIVLPPYFLAQGKKSLKKEEYLVHNIMDHYDSRSLRIFLATAINWLRKETVLDFNLLNLIQKMSYRLYGAEFVATTFPEALLGFDSLKLREILSKARKTRQELFYKELYGIVGGEV